MQQLARDSHGPTAGNLTIGGSPKNDWWKGEFSDPWFKDSEKRHERFRRFRAKKLRGKRNGPGVCMTSNRLCRPEAIVPKYWSVWEGTWNNWHSSKLLWLCHFDSICIAVVVYTFLDVRNSEIGSCFRNIQLILHYNCILQSPKLLQSNRFRKFSGPRRIFL